MTAQLYCVCTFVCCVKVDPIANAIKSFDGSIEKTAAMISAIIMEPEPTQTRLKRLQFRFLHRLVFEIMKKTGFAIDRFDDKEKDVEALSKRDGAVLLQKLFNITGEALDIDIDVNPEAVIKHTEECAKTRRFLQLFSTAATRDKVCR